MIRGFEKSEAKVKREYINFWNAKVHAIYYSAKKTVYYNVNGKNSKLICFKP